MAVKKTTKPEAVEQMPEEAMDEAVETKEDDDRVTVFIPYIEGEDPEVTVWVNDECTKIRKGHQVRVKRNVAEVLSHANQQAMVAMENRRKLKSQHQDW